MERSQNQLWQAGWKMADGRWIFSLYNKLLSQFGYQGWWPLLKEGRMHYHPGDYSYPRNERQRFEICIGAILTQNISWNAAASALANLDRLGALHPEKLPHLPLPKLKAAIKPAGYFNQKAKKIREFCRLYQSLEGRNPSREELLSTWGIGQETADSILLYAYNVPTFVVDAYTKRLLFSLGKIGKGASYEEIKRMFEDNLPKDAKLYNEFHALIVENGKRARAAGKLERWKMADS
jgi:endonuclease-3 related protein